jgi:transglutaminase-like putative cysteine protease
MSRSRVTRTSAELALVGVSLANVLGFIRVFADFTFLPVLATTVVAAHLLAVGCRRLGWGTIVSCVVSAGGLAIAAPLLLVRDTTWYGLPTHLSWTTIRLELVDAWNQFSTAKAPVPAEAGFLAAALIAVWVAAWLADTFAFRFDALIEAIVPTAGVFLFVSVLARPDYRLVSCALYLLAVFAFVAMHRAWLDERAPGWLADSSSSIAPTVLRTTLKVGAVAVVAALVLGPALPGAGEAPLWDLDTSGGGGTRVTLSPLVDIRGQLVDQSDQVAFEVTSPTAAYWRLMSLDTFTGEIWESPDSKYTGVSGDLPITAAPGITGETVVQTFSIKNLSSFWLPAAFTPISVSGGGSVSFDVDSASLITNKESASGLTYQVTSVIANLQPAQLEAADTISISPELRKRYTQLPRDFPQKFHDQALAITGDASSEYDRALVLQNWFRDNFKYDLSFRAGHDENAIESFLEQRRGYCEQFAATYAAFARSIGIPARVAVGFTSGELTNGVYIVRGKFKHAWPEVYFDGIGWVPFEPTPTRGAPGAESYTHVVPQQAGADDSTTNDATATTAEPGGASPTVSIPTGDEFASLIPGGGGNVEAVGLAGAHKPSVWPHRLLVALIAVLVFGLLWIIVVPLARRRQRHNRREAATTPSARVLVAWEEAAEAFSIAGIPPKGPETYREFAQRASTATPVPRSAMRALADDASAAQFSGDPLPEDVAERAEATLTEIETALSGSTPAARKLLGKFDPRPLRKPAAKRKVQEAEHPVRV